MPLCSRQNWNVNESPDRRGEICTLILMRTDVSLKNTWKVALHSHYSTVKIVMVNKNHFSNMAIGTPLSFRKMSASLPQTADTASQTRNAAFVLLTTGTSQDQKSLIKVCFIVIKRKKTQTPKHKRQNFQSNRVVMIHATQNALFFVTVQEFVHSYQ